MKKESGSETRQRSGLIGFRVTPQERAEIEAAAEQAGLTVGSYVRLSLLTAPETKPVKRPPTQAASLARLLGQLGKIGGNLNQIAARLNRYQDVTDQEIKAALEGLKELRTEILEALGKRSRCR